VLCEEHGRASEVDEPGVSVGLPLLDCSNVILLVISKV
jgi:hypothetical protein